MLLLSDLDDVTDEVTILGNNLWRDLGERLVFVEIDSVPDGSRKVHEPSSGDSHTRQTVVVAEEARDTGPYL